MGRLRVAPGLALCMLATPLVAFEPHGVEQCRAAWLAMGDLLPERMAMSDGDRQDFLAVSHRVSADGWCRLSGADPALEGAQFATLDWQVEGLAEALASGTFPMAIRVRIDNLRPEDVDMPSRTDFVPPPPVDLTATLRRVPDARQLILEALQVTSPAGDDLRATAVFDRVDLSSVAMAQMSMGGIALRQANLRFRINGWVESQIIPNLDIEVRGDDEAVRMLLLDFARGLPPGFLADGALQEIEAFAGDLPAPRGDIEVSLKSERGLGLMQIMINGARTFVDPSSAELVLDGVTADVLWSPDPDQTE